MLLVNQNNAVDAKSVNASLIALKNQADKLNRQIATLEKSIKSLDGSKVDEKDLSNYYTKQSIDDKLTNYQYPTIKETDANNCIPVLNATKTYELPTTASNVPNNNYAWNIISTLNDRNNAYRLTQIAQGQTGTSTLLYIRVASSTNQGVSYTFGTWQKLATEGDLISVNNDLLNNVQWQNGYLANSTEQTATNAPLGSQDSNRLEITSNAIEVSEGKYIFSIKSSSPNTNEYWGSVGLFLENGSFSSRLAFIGSNVRNLDYKFTVPTNIKFIRVSHRTYGNCISELHKLS